MLSFEIIFELVYLFLVIIWNFAEYTIKIQQFYILS